MYDRILIPTDGSAGAEVGARHGVAIANRFDCSIDVLSIVDERAFSHQLADFDDVIAGQRDAVTQEAQSAIDALDEVLAEASGSVETAIEEGVPAEIICSYAIETDADLISMGTHGRTGLDRLLLGSVTERVVRTSEVPVLTVSGDPTAVAGYDDVLVPTDGSEAATKAVDHAIAIASAFDATVHVISVVDVTDTFGGSGPTVSNVLEQLESDAKQAVSDIVEACEDKDLSVETAIAQGAPYRAIVDYIEDAAIDIVTMGTHGRSGLDRYLIGSVTERVVRTSDVPVLTVR